MKPLAKLRASILASLGFILCVACSPSSPEGQSGDQAGSQFGGQIEKVSVGEITATIDGTAYRGETLNVPSEGTSTAEFMAIGPMTTLNIQAHDPEAGSILENVFSVDFSLMGNDSSASINEANVFYFPQGMNAPFYLNEGPEAETEVVLESLSLEEDAASVAGRFTARLCRKADAFSEADAGDCVMTEGTFDTELSERASPLEAG